MDEGKTAPTVLQVLPALDTGGVEMTVLELNRAVAEAGWRSVVASAGGRLVSAVEAAGGRHVVLPLDRRGPLAIWRNAARLAALIGQARIDLVHAHSRAPAWSALLAARRRGVKLVTSYHSPFNENLPFKRRYNSVMASGDRVIAVSRHVAALAVARHGIDPARLRVIHGGVDPAQFDPDAVDPARTARLAAAWRIRAGTKVAMLPGRLTRWKGQALFIDALARLGRTDVVGVLVGDVQGRRGYVAALREAASRRGLDRRLRFAGDCDDMPAALALADVVVNASTDPEGFGRTVIEAQAMRRPVIVADHGGAAETVADGETGWRFPPGDADALAGALGRALALSDAARVAIGAASRASVVRNFSIAAMQAATLELYRELLADTPR